MHGEGGRSWFGVVVSLDLYSAIIPPVFVALDRSEWIVVNKNGRPGRQQDAIAKIGTDPEPDRV